MHLHIATTDEVDRIARFFDDDVRERDVLAIVQQINDVTATFMRRTVKEQVSARFNRDDFVSDVTALLIVSLDNVTAIDAPADDGEVLDFLSPHQRIVKMAVTKVLVFFKLVWLR